VYKSRVPARPGGKNVYGSALFVGPQFGICITSPFWRLKCLKWLLDFLKNFTTLKL